MKLQQIGPNQTQLTIPAGVIFFSYETPVAALVYDTYYRTSEYHSRTTSKHINQWLGGVKADEIKIKPQEFFNNLVK